MAQEQAEGPSEDSRGLRTLGDYVRWGASRLNAARVHFGHGTDNALDEALALVLYALELGELAGPGRTLPGELFHARLTPPERARVESWLGRRIEERIPLPYLTGEAWFAGLAFSVDPRVLIPRSPFAELIESGFQPWLDPGRVRRIADIGTGSGCLAIACAYAFPEASVEAGELDPGALEVACANVRRHCLSDRVQVRRSDVLSGLSGTFDVLISNPPYVRRARLGELPAEYLHEPAAALDGGGDGMDLVRRLIAQAPGHLAPGGAIFLEVGESHAELEQAFPRLEVTWLDEGLERGGEGLCYLPADRLARAC